MIKPANEFWITILRKEKKKKRTQINCEISGHGVAIDDQKFEDSG